MSAHHSAQPAGPTGAPLDRQIGLGSAVSLNMLEMVGVGPFITMPLIIAAMGGPQAMLGWVLGALLAVCDGLVWAELGAALPFAGGSYAFLREIYGPRGAGRMLSFLFVWQFTLTAPLSIASGAIGLGQYAAYLVPALNHPILPYLRGSVFVAVGVCCLAMLLLYRQTRVVERIAWFLSAGLLLTIAAVLVACFTHFHPALAFSFPRGAFRFSTSFFDGLGAATLLATYCYWGYYNICFLGSEVREPGRTIPRGVLYSILGVASLYLLMNIGLLGAVPWQDLLGRYSAANPVAAVANVIDHLMGPLAGRVVAALVMWTAFASLFSLLLGASRVPYAAATEGNYFRALGKLHPTRGFPGRSLLLLGGIACVCCFFDLKDRHPGTRRAAHRAAVYAAAVGGHRAAPPPAGSSPALPHVALPHSRAGGLRRLSLHAHLPSRRRPRAARCAGGLRHRQRRLSVARKTSAGVALSARCLNIRIAAVAVVLGRRPVCLDGRSPLGRPVR